MLKISTTASDKEIKTVVNKLLSKNREGYNQIIKNISDLSDVNILKEAINLGFIEYDDTSVVPKVKRFLPDRINKKYGVEFIQHTYSKDYPNDKIVDYGYTKDIYDKFFCVSLSVRMDGKLNDIYHINKKYITIDDDGEDIILKITFCLLPTWSEEFNYGVDLSYSIEYEDDGHESMEYSYKAQNTTATYELFVFFFDKIKAEKTIDKHFLNDLESLQEEYNR
jgi:hypothetical protein